MDAAVLWTPRTRPQDLENRTERGFPQRPHALFLWKEDSTKNWRPLNGQRRSTHRIPDTPCWSAQELRSATPEFDESGQNSRGILPALLSRMAMNPADALTKITELIIAAAIAVHRVLGPGLLESAYQACLEHELLQRKVNFERQVVVPLDYRGIHIDCGYRLDFLIEERVVVEVKSVERLMPIHLAQLITYLKLTKSPVGLLLNFNVTSMRLGGIRRITNRSLIPSATDLYVESLSLPDLNDYPSE